MTAPLPLDRPLQLELNANCHSGWIACEVLPPGDWEFDPIAGCDADASRTEHADFVRRRVTWSARDTVAPVPAGRCRLRITLRQGSLFSYRWRPA